MRKIREFAPATMPARISNNADFSFVFSDDITDWMPKFRQQRDTVKESMRKARNIVAFRRANNGMMCSFKKDSSK